jgi:hypothetical protein
MRGRVLLGQQQVIRQGRDDGGEIAGQRLPMRVFVKSPLKFLRLLSLITCSFF